jgi:hypothetical protein
VPAGSTCNTNVFAALEVGLAATKPCVHSFLALECAAWSKWRKYVFGSEYIKVTFCTIFYTS